MKKLCLLLAVAAVIPALASAQSSGNFTYGTTGNTTGCVLKHNGGLSGGTSNCGISVGASTFACTGNQDCLNILGSNSGASCSGAGGACLLNTDCASGVCVLGTAGGTCAGNCTEPNPGLGGCIGSLQAQIKTSSGKGNVFVVRPSAVIALLTDVTVSSKQSDDGSGGASGGGCFTSALSGTVCMSTAAAGIDFAVSVTGAPGTPNPASVPGRGVPITYAARFIQISTNLFTAIATQCAAITNGCFLTFAESTASAHSFDWIVGAPTGAGSGNSGSVAGAPLQSGLYNVNVAWTPSAVFQVAGIAEAAACVGPVNLTVQQNKIFSFNTVNSF